MSTFYATVGPDYNQMNKNLPDLITARQHAGETDVIDNSGNLTFLYSENNPSPHTSDVLLQDTNYALLHENIIYILGAVTVASLVITIMLVDKK